MGRQKRGKRTLGVRFAVFSASSLALISECGTDKICRAKFLNLSKSSLFILGGLGRAIDFSDTILECAMSSDGKSQAIASVGYGGSAQNADSSFS